MVHTNGSRIWSLNRRTENSVFENTMENQGGRSSIMARIFGDALCTLSWVIFYHLFRRGLYYVVAIQYSLILFYPSVYCFFVFQFLI